MSGHRRHMAYIVSWDEGGVHRTRRFRVRWHANPLDAFQAWMLTRAIGERAENVVVTHGRAAKEAKGQE